MPLPMAKINKFVINNLCFRPHPLEGGFVFESLFGAGVLSVVCYSGAF